MTFAGHLQALGNALDSFGFNIGSYRISAYHVVVGAIVLLAMLAVGRLVSKLARRLIRGIDALDPAQELLAEKFVSIAVWSLLALIGISILDVDLTALTVFSGAFGLAVGFGLQKTIGNLMAGIILLMDRSIKPGDVIAINDGIALTVGQVKKIGFRAVSVTTRDKKEYLIPNENLMINQVENWSYSSREVRIRVPVGVAYGADIDLAETLMLQAARDCPRVLQEPPPSAWLVGIGESTIQFEIQCWIDDPEEGLDNLRSDVLKRVWRLFHENGVEVPFAQRDLNLRDNKVLRELIAAIRGARVADPPEPQSLAETLPRPKGGDHS